MNIDIDDNNGVGDERMIRVDLLLIARPIKNKSGLKAFDLFLVLLISFMTFLSLLVLMLCSNFSHQFKKSSAATIKL